MTEGRGTSIPIIRKRMAKNGSPAPRFDTDENYNYFITTLPMHPVFLSDGGIIWNKGIVEYRGAKKTGGYHLTEAAKEKLK